MSRKERRSDFTTLQDQIIVDAVKRGGFNNLSKTFRDLTNIQIFEGYSYRKIANRYYTKLRKSTPMFKIVSTEFNTLTSRVNYKNDPAFRANSNYRNRYTNQNN